MDITITLQNRNKVNKLIPIPNILPILLLCGDICNLFFSCAITLWFYLGKNLNWFDPFIYAFVLLIIAVLYLADTYNADSQIAGLRAPARIVISNLIISGITAVLVYLTGYWGKDPLFGRGVLLISLGIFTILAVISRLLAAKWLRSHAEQSYWLMLGTNEKAIQFGHFFQKFNSLGRLVVLAEADQDTSKLANTPLTCLGTLNDLSTWSQLPWAGVVVATQEDLSDAQVQYLMQIRLQGIPVYRVPDVCESLWYKLPSSLLQDSWLAFSVGFNLVSGSIDMKLKWFIDKILGLILLLCLSPLMLLVSLIIKLDSPGPVFYSQTRTGLEGKLFKVYKFRSMYQDAEKRGAQWASLRDPRITRVGYWLRLMRIDELPQILNVLRGDMSLIGPRPERPEFDTKLKQEIPYYDLRYLVKPGITGWAQVMYPYGASIEDAYEKLSYDLYYIKNYSFWLDLAIFFKTMRVVLLGKGR